MGVAMRIQRMDRCHPPGGVWEVFMGEEAGFAPHYMWWGGHVEQPMSLGTVSRSPMCSWGKITGLVQLKSREPESGDRNKAGKIPRVLPVEGLE